MKRLEAVAGHTRLFRRGAVYYHRAAIPQDIRSSYPKTEETFSLRTKDYSEALRRVRLAAVEVDQRFTAHRQHIAHERSALLETLATSKLPDDRRNGVTELCKPTGPRNLRHRKDRLRGHRP